MDIKPNTVTCAVRHAAPCVGRIGWWHATGKSMRMNDAKRGAVDIFTRCTCAHGGNRRAFRLKYRAVHAHHFRMYVSMHHRARAVTVVESLLATWEDVNDHRLPSSQVTMAVLMAVRTLRSTCNNGWLIAETKFQKMHINHEPQVFCRKALGLVVQDAICIGRRTRHRLTCHAHGIFRGRLRTLEPLNLLRVL
jgi:hypothetical protein